VILKTTSQNLVLAYFRPSFTYNLFLAMKVVVVGIATTVILAFISAKFVPRLNADINQCKQQENNPSFSFVHGIRVGTPYAIFASHQIGTKLAKFYTILQKITNITQKPCWRRLIEEDKEKGVTRNLQKC